MSLTNREIARYSRQIILPGVGVGGQLSFKNSKVFVVGAGGLGENMNMKRIENVITKTFIIVFSSFSSSPLRLPSHDEFMWCRSW